MATHETISLSDPESGTSAQVIPGLGFNCVQFRANDACGNLEVLWSEPGFTAGARRASGSGIPLLFPFPGRIAGTVLHWDGKDYVLDAGDGQGNAIHGFVHERSWRVLRRETSLVVGQFHASRDDAAILEKWPADFRITATYEVGDNRLSLTILLENPDDRELPCGFGAHPYFRVPLGGVAAEKCRVRLPVASSWELVDMNATGRLLPLEDAARYQRGQEFGSMRYDNVFSGLVFSGAECCASIEDPESGRRVVLSFDRAFRECVVYTPPHRGAICIEPYTCVPDAFRLTRQGIDAGLRVLGLGESFAARLEISVL